MIMKCGCAPQGISEGRPICIVHSEVNATDGVDLTGRRAFCVYCKKPVESSDSLPFFEYRPIEANDRYYCFCRG